MSVENSKDVITNTSNPYYVHHSDQLRQLLVLEKLNGSNYPTWSKSMTHAIFQIQKDIVTITLKVRYLFRHITYKSRAFGRS